MTWIPDELRALSIGLDQDHQTVPKVTVRQLLAWFQHDRRGSRVVAYVNKALRELDLHTDPDFEDAWIDGEVAFYRASAPTRSATQPQAERAEPAKPPAARPDVEAPADPQRDPVHCIGNFKAANTQPVVVKPDTSLREVMTIMMRHDYSQVPVMVSDRNHKGAVSWRSIARKTAFARAGAESNETGSKEPAALTARDCLVHAPECSHTTSVFEVIPMVLAHGFVLVRAIDQKIVGIVTLHDLVEEFGGSLEPFSLLGEVEKHLRNLLDTHVGIDVLRAIRTPAPAVVADDSILSASDLTFGDYVRLFQRPEVWLACGLPVDRAEFVRGMEAVRLIRNEVMHFQRDAVEPKDLTTLRSFAVFAEGELREDLRDITRNI